MRLLLPLVLAAALCACSGQQPPEPGTLPPPTPAETPEGVVWARAPEGIRISLTASADANLVNDDPHVVTICIYQAKTVEGLTARAATREGLIELLQCRPDFSESVKATQRYVQPGEEAIFTLERAEGARYLAVVAGFDHLDPAACYASTPIPIHTETTRPWYLFPKSTSYTAAPMDAVLHLDAGQVDLKGVERVF